MTLRGSTSAANHRFRSKTPRSMVACIWAEYDAFDIVLFRRVLLLVCVDCDDFASCRRLDDFCAKTPPRNRMDLHILKVCIRY